MIKHSIWKGAAISALVILPMAFASVVNRADAAPEHQSARRSTHAAHCPSPRGTVRFSDTEFPETLNPTQASFQVDGLLDNAILESLFSYKSRGKIFAEMAASVPTVKNGDIRDGGKTWVVRLKQGLHWSNGVEITSADIKFSWDAAMSPASGPWCLGTCDIINRIAVPSKYEAVFHLAHPYAAADDYAINGFYLVPRSWPGYWAKGDVKAAVTHLYLDSSFNYESSSFPTDGPYQVTKFNSSQGATLSPMRYYHNMVCGSRLKSLQFVYYPARDPMISAASHRRTDVTTNYTRVDLGALRRHHKQFRTVVTPDFEFEHFELNTDSKFNGKPNPLHTANVRIALALALDKLSLIRKSQGVGNATAKQIVAWTPLSNFPAFHFSQPFADTAIQGQWDPLVHRFISSGSPLALKDARKLLSDTRWKHGFALSATITAGTPYRDAELAAAATSWARLGVHLNIHQVLPSQFFSHVWSDQGLLDHGKFQLADFSYFGKPDPDQFKFNLASRYCDRRQATHSVINGNDSCIHDPLIDTAFQQAAGSLNPKTRAYWYDRMQVELNKLAYWIPLYYNVEIHTVDGKVANVTGNPTQIGMTWNVYDWKHR